MTSPLFMIDQTPFTAQDCEQILLDLQHTPVLGKPETTRLAVCLKDAGHWLALCLRLKAIGGSVLPIHPGTPAAVARKLARDTGCTHLLLGDQVSADALETLTDQPALPAATGGELIQLSSGTTGEPKAIRRPWAHIDRELAAYVGHFPEARDLTPVIACPVTHSYGLICGVLASIQRGLMPRVISNLNPRYILSILRSEPQHLLYGSPTLIGLLVHLLPESTTLHTVMLSGAPLPAPAMQRLQQSAQRLCQQYGCSEAGCVALTPALSDAGHLGAPLPHLTVQAGTPDQPAEIVVHPDLPGATPVHTRDLGFLDNEGQLHFLARIDDTINVAGINVYPSDVEDVLLAYPGIREAVAYKQPDPYAGERVCVRIVADSDIDTGDLRRWCQDKLSPHQMPTLIDQADSIPKLGNGKISRRLLAEPDSAKVRRADDSEVAS